MTKRKSSCSSKEQLLLTSPPESRTCFTPECNNLAFIGPGRIARSGRWYWNREKLCRQCLNDRNAQGNKERYTLRTGVLYAFYFPEHHVLKVGYSANSERIRRGSIGTFRAKRQIDDPHGEVIWLADSENFNGEAHLQALLHKAGLPVPEDFGAGNRISEWFDTTNFSREEIVALLDRLYAFPDPQPTTLGVCVNYLGKQGPYGRLMAVLVNIVAQLARNHGLPIPGTIDPQDLVDGQHDKS